MITSYGQNPVPHAGVEFDKNDWAPRIGFAWSVRRNTVIRSAGGIFYSAEANIFDDLGSESSATHIPREQFQSRSDAPRRPS